MRQKLNILLISVFLLSGLKNIGQVTVTAIPPAAVRFTLDDLWNITAVKNSESLNNINLNIQINAYDKKGTRFLSAITNTFQFKNQKIININRATLTQYQPINVTYYDNGFKTKLSRQGGTFPSGDYKIEIIVNAVGTGYSEPLGKYVYNINAELTFPIQLLSVYDKDTIKELNPTFTWIPPYPLPTGNVDYEITVTEILPNQTADAAILENQPLIKKTIPNQNVLYYSPANPKFIDGKDYAWNVKVVQAGTLYSQSDIWSYSYRLMSDSIEYMPQQYFVMQEKIPNNCVTIDSNILPITFTEGYYIMDSLLQMNIYDSTGIIIANESDIPIAYTEGSNYTFISFCPDEFSLANGRYVLEVILVNNQKYYLRFRNNSGSAVCAY